MARRTRIGIIRARHDTSVPLIDDQACLEMFFHNARRDSVFDYWESVTRGHLDFVDSALMPWVDITLSADETGRAVVAKKAYDALAARSGGRVSGEFDGWIVLTLPGTGLDAGTGGALGGKSVCTVGAMTGNHTFYCHELGHVLGFAHTYGLVNNGIEWDGMPPWDEGTVYGDPFDLMSSASFGTRNLDATKPMWTARPTFSAAVPAGWPQASTNGSMGPAPSAAHLHQWDPASFPAGTVRTETYPAPGRAVRATLTSAGLGRGATSLLALTPPGEDAEGRRRVYVEYRGRHGWDRGLDSVGGDLARQAVVVHVRRDAPGDGVRTWYAGQVHVPLGVDTDVAPEGTGLVVRVTHVAEDGSSAEVEVTAPVERQLQLSREVRKATLGFTDGEPRTTPCGDRVEFGNLIQQTTTIYTLRTRGYGGAGDPAVPSPVVRWRVGTVDLVAPGDLTDVEVVTDQGQFTVQYSLRADDPSELVLVGRGGERYTAPVSVTVTENGGSEARQETSVFDPVGWEPGYREEDAAALARCLEGLLDEAKVIPADWLIPGGRRHPGWGRFDPLTVERINVGRIEHLAERVRDTSPVVSAGLEQIAALRTEVLRQR